MTPLLGNIAFLNPWILAGFAALPALWFLLRIMPPSPRLIALPTARFLEGLIPEQQTPDRTPWWILLLRIMIAALTLLALSQPVWNPAAALPGTGPVRLIIDNGWAAAQAWDRLQAAAGDVIARATRENREIYILPVAAVPGAESPAAAGPLAGPQAAALLRAMRPVPWPGDYQAARKIVEQAGAMQNFWFSHGLDEGGFRDTASALAARGGLSVFSPEPRNLPLLLRKPVKTSYALEIAVDATPAGAAGLPVRVEALSDNGRVLDVQSTILGASALPHIIRFDIPEVLRAEVASLRIAGRAGAGGIFILDEKTGRRAVGILGVAEDSEPRPFIDAAYYLRRALEPYAKLQVGPLDTLLAAGPSVIILPDVGAMPAAALSRLEAWVREGGLLLRFAGPKMTESAESAASLVPVPLRLGARSSGGNMSWENTPKLKEFPPESPLAGLSIHEDIPVRRQALAEPFDGLESRIWARLDDGTPLVTGAPLDRGLLVMVHTTASPEWSDLALSGIYVEMLRRIIGLSGRRDAALTADGASLQPLWVLDGMGATRKPGANAKPIPAAAFAQTAAGPHHPPGLYTSGNVQKALNVGAHAPALKSLPVLPPGSDLREYGTRGERNLMPTLLCAALALLATDWLIMIIMMTELRVLSRFSGLSLLVLCMFFALPAHAQDTGTDARYADDLYLAYIRSGDAALDAQSQKGLENLVAVLRRRTSAEPGGVAGLDPERDTLAFFPLLYWPVSGRQPALSAGAIARVQDYLDHGGTILFDTREQGTGAASGGANAQALRKLIAALNIPPLAPIEDSHVLGRSFYLIDSFPGRYTGGTLWVETDSASGRDGVSSVIIGPNDWGAAWAAGLSGPNDLGGATRQQEISYRFGVNLVMYALTGNYKADQVHVPHILERLGQ